MKRISFYILALCAFTIILNSCGKEEDEGMLPNIGFKNSAAYTHANETVGMNDTLLVGIFASKAEDKDILKTFDASVKYDADADSSFYSEQLSGSNEDNYTKDLQIITHNQAGTEKYTFTVVNRDGLKNQVSFTLTVQ